MFKSLLALDSSTEYGSICVYTNGQFYSVHEPMPRKHASDTLPVIEKLMSDAGLTLSDLDGIVFGRGPGSFTGLRISAGIVQGLGLALNKPIYPVSTLTALSMQADLSEGDLVLPALDARMNEVYWCPHRINAQGIPEPLEEEQVLPPESIQWHPEYRQADALGNGWTYQQQMESTFLSLELKGNIEKYPNACDMVRWVLAVRPEGISSEKVNPIYLRDKVTWDNKPKVGS